MVAPRNPIAPRRGFACPKCNAATHTSRTYKPQHGLVVRYRRCPICGWKVTTEERVSKTRGRVMDSFPLPPTDVGGPFVG